MYKLVGASLGALVLLSAWSEPASALSGTSTESPAAGDLQALIERYNAERSAIFTRMSAAETAEEKAEIYASADRMSFIEGFQEISFNEAGTDTAAEAFVWIVRLGKEFHPKEAKEAAGLLLEVHPDSQVLTQLVDELRYPGELGVEYSGKLLRKVRKIAKRKDVQANATFALANHLMGGHWDEAKNAAGMTEARALLVGLQSNMDATVVHNAERALYEVDNLQIGMIAPDFEASDADGNAFKLSDYRGKVTVIDYWGFW